MDGAVVHWAGPVVRIGTRRRQRCLWCGAAIDDVDLAGVAMLIPDGKTEEQARADGDLEPASWQAGAWVGVDGAVRWVERSVEDDEALGPDAQTPERSCCRLDPEVTG